MATRKRPSPAADAAAVDALLQELDHPHLSAIRALRTAITGAAASITEGVKWNAPSFRTTEWFATVHLRERRGIALILHLGAKARALPSGVEAVADPQHLLQWLGPDRARIVFADLADVHARRPALQELVRRWIAHV
ncbi:MAG: DUF1801 domain-containing protein [Planctomycetes bacterium]|nr:DUF1801 domain-containing protein [Planctomycetota bacterium]